MAALPFASPPLANYVDSADARWADSYCRAKMSATDDYGWRDRGTTEAQIADCSRAVTCALSAGRTYGYADRRYMAAVEMCAPGMSDQWNEAPTRASVVSDSGGRMLAVLLLGAAVVLTFIWFVVHAMSGSAL